MMNFLSRLTSKAAISASVVALCVGLSGTAQALDFSKISAVYFFGDSLTDSGYFNGLPKPTFTTFAGYPWSQYVASDILGINLSDPTTNNTTNAIIPTPPAPVPPQVILPTSGALSGINYAAGGSATNGFSPSILNSPSLHLQVTQYLSDPNTPVRLDPNAVYFIWSGPNDFLRTLSQNPSTPADILQLLLLQTAQTAATNIGNEAASLSARGAKRIVVLSMPNLGLTPFIQLLSPSNAGSMKNVSFTFNGMLNMELGRVTAQYGTKILYIDTYTEFENLIVATAAGQPITVGGKTFTFSNATDYACKDAQPPLPALPNALTCVDSDNVARPNYLFADLLHPTDLGHQAIAALVESEIKNWK